MNQVDKPLAAFDFATSGNFADICYGVVLKPNDENTGHKAHHFPDPARLGPKGFDPKLHPVTLVNLTFALSELTQDHLLFGWGSLGYDCSLLYGESEAKDEAVKVTFAHCDLFWQTALLTQRWVSLPEVGLAYDIRIDPKFSARVPELWHKDEESQHLVRQHHLACAKAILYAAKQVKRDSEFVYIDKQSGKQHTVKLSPQPNSYYLKHVLALPETAFSRVVNEPTRWLRRPETLTEVAEHASR